MNSAGWTSNAPARSSSILQLNNGKCVWPPTRMLSLFPMHQEKPVSTSKGKHSMICSNCNQDAEVLTDGGICVDCRIESEERRFEIIELAREQRQEEGLVEIDDDARLSEGNDNGCYVAAWVWADFADTKFDKEMEEKNENEIAQH